MTCHVVSFHDVTWAIPASPALVAFPATSLTLTSGALMLGGRTVGLSVEMLPPSVVHRKNPITATAASARIPFTLLPVYLSTSYCRPSAEKTSGLTTRHPQNAAETPATNTTNQKVSLPPVTALSSYFHFVKAYPRLVVTAANRAVAVRYVVVHPVTVDPDLTPKFTSGPLGGTQRNLLTTGVVQYPGPLAVV